MRDFYLGASSASAEQPRISKLQKKNRTTGVVMERDYAVFTASCGAAAKCVSKIKTKVILCTTLAFFFGADYGARTRHLHLGKVALYQMS